MATSKEELQNFLDKVDIEGGLEYYLMHYGGSVPLELMSARVAFVWAHNRFTDRLNKLCKQHGIEGIE